MKWSKLDKYQELIVHTMLGKSLDPLLNPQKVVTNIISERVPGWTLYDTASSTINLMQGNYTWASVPLIINGVESEDIFKLMYIDHMSMLTPENAASTLRLLRLFLGYPRKEIFGMKNADMGSNIFNFVGGNVTPGANTILIYTFV